MLVKGLKFIETYLENVKLSIAEIEITKRKDNLSHNEHKAVKELPNNSATNLRFFDKGSRRVVVKKSDKTAVL